MGFFDKFKKKNKVSETDAVFKQFGAETNEVKTPQKQTRKQAQEQAEAARISEVKKDQLLERLSDLRKRIVTSNDNTIASYAGRIEDLYAKLRRASDNHDKEAMAVVDNFILRAITDGTNYCNRNSWVGLSASLDVLEDLISDRYDCRPYFKDPQYCKCRLMEDSLKVQNKELEAKIKSINQRGAALRVKYNDPQYKAEQTSIANEMVGLKEERERNEKRIQENNQKINLAAKMRSEIERSVENKVEENQFDFETQFDDVYAKQRESDMKISSIGKMNERMDTSTVKYTDSSLGVDASTDEESPAATIDINSLGF
ncbi:MAG: hypothetical protein IKC37_00145 [Clostridia bacterium]|nr:hypothetical protein [Clostridia bacterium]